MAGNVTSEADFRGILDDVGDPGLAKTANSKHPMLFEVQPANMPGTLNSEARAQSYVSRALP